MGDEAVKKMKAKSGGGLGKNWVRSRPAILKREHLRERKKDEPITYDCPHADNNLSGKQAICIC